MDNAVEFIRATETAGRCKNLQANPTCARDEYLSRRNVARQNVQLDILLIDTAAAWLYMPLDFYMTPCFASPRSSGDFDSRRILDSDEEVR